MARNPQRNEEEIFVAIESFAGLDANGTPVQVLRGARFRGGKGSLPAKHPALFLPDGALDSEILAAREAAGITGY
jgi:hypothetical protein